MGHLQLKMDEPVNHIAKSQNKIATWKKPEIEKLETLLLEYGTDFSTISRLIGKSRDQVKRKFKVLQKINPNFGFEGKQ